MGRGWDGVIREDDDSYIDGTDTIKPQPIIRPEGIQFIKVGPGGIEDIVSPDAETAVNEAGGKQSHVPVRFDLIDAKAIFEMAKVLHEGAEKYGEDNWRLIPVEDHLNHAIMHAYAYLAGDRTDDHLSHIMCRATFATAVAITDEENSNE